MKPLLPRTLICVRAPIATLLASMLLTGPASGQSIGASWEGIRATGFVPPDTHGAPGPNGVIAAVNLTIQYYTKSGATIWGPITARNFWSPAGNSGSGITPLDRFSVVDPNSTADSDGDGSQDVIE